jgi:hypothetical protein
MRAGKPPYLRTRLTVVLHFWPPPAEPRTLRLRRPRCEKRESDGNDCKEEGEECEPAEGEASTHQACDRRQAGDINEARWRHRATCADEEEQEDGASRHAQLRTLRESASRDADSLVAVGATIFRWERPIGWLPACTVSPKREICGLVATQGAKGWLSSVHFCILYQQNKSISALCRSSKSIRTKERKGK